MEDNFQRSQYILLGVIAFLRTKLMLSEAQFRFEKAANIKDIEFKLIDLKKYTN